MFHPAIPATDRPGIVSDAVLDRLAQIIPTIHARPLTDDEGRLLLSSIGPVVDELRNARRKLALIADVAEPDNVVMFPGARV